MKQTWKICLICASLTMHATVACAQATETIGNWTKECSGQGVSGACAYAITAVKASGHAPVARLTIGKQKGDGQIIFGLLLPLGVSIPAGIVIEVSDGRRIALPLLTCNSTGCLAARNVGPEEFDVLTSTESITVSFKEFGQKGAAKIGIPVKGIEAVLKEVGSKN